jgi:hypothetical protein
MGMDAMSEALSIDTGKVDDLFQIEQSGEAGDGVIDDPWPIWGGPARLWPGDEIETYQQSCPTLKQIGNGENMLMSANEARWS